MADQKIKKLAEKIRELIRREGEQLPEPEVVVITGGTSGVGRATARKFASKGAKVAILARGEDGLLGTKKDIEDLGGVALTIRTDVSDPVQVEKACLEVEEKLGPIDVWINNAMANVLSPVSRMKPEEFRRVTDVTYHGQVYSTLAVLKRMLSRNRGVILFVGSEQASRGIPLQSAYCGAEQAIVGFVDSLRKELIHDNSNVRVTLVQLPAINTPQYTFVKSSLSNKTKPLGKIFQPEVAAEAIYFASKNNRKEVHVGGPSLETLLVDNNPLVGEKYLASSEIEKQLLSEPEDPKRRNNLWEPVPGDPSARGKFDANAAEFSPQLWLTKHREALLIAAGVLVTGLFTLKALSGKKIHQPFS
jgi:NADP-dependent 3-hydroxy acid dehydrogenase YdfG